MRSLLGFVVLVGSLSCALPSCRAGARFRSVVAPDFKGPLTQLYILANVGAGSKNFEGADNVSVAEFAVRFDALGKKCGVAIVVEEYRQDLTVAPDGDSAPIERLFDAGADRLLTVRLDGGTIDPNGGGVQSDYDLRLWDLDTGRTMWSAVARLGSGSNRSEVLARCLVLQLSIDGVIPASCAKPLEETTPRELPDYRRNAAKPSKWDPACGIGN